MRNIIKVGDVIMCIKNGGNNTGVGGFKNTAIEGDGPFIVKAIHEGESKFMYDTMNTLETECGKFLWNNTEWFEVIENKEPIYEIY